MSDPIVRGKVHVVEETKSYGQNGFRKRMVVVEQDKGRFVNYIPVEFTHEGCDSLDDLNVGDEVEIPYRLNGRKWQRDPQSEVKFFLNAEGLSFNVLKDGGGDGGGGGASSDDAPMPTTPDYVPQVDDDDDVPF